jgi:hypothetical protein
MSGETDARRVDRVDRRHIALIDEVVITMP